MDHGCGTEWGKVSCAVFVRGVSRCLLAVSAGDTYLRDSLCSSVQTQKFDPDLTHPLKPGSPADHREQRIKTAQLRVFSLPGLE